MPDAPTLRFVTFNIRCPVRSDGDNYWEPRKPFTAETIRTLAPDLIGLQECYREQADYLAEQVPEYDYIGVGRDDGRDAGEMVPLFHRRDRVQRLDACHFWLSEKPTEPGSKSWDTAITRMCTWGRFAIDGTEFCVFNAHFDHVGEEARLKSAELVRSRVKEVEPVPCVVMGDFNAAPDSPPHKALVSEGLIDAGLASDDQPKESGTFHGFKGNTDGGRIDWIVLTPHWKPRSYAVDHLQKGGLYPSDHFPVVADVVLRSQ